MTQRKTALVTGSTSGIGRAIAEALAVDGVNVMLNGFGDATEIDHLRSQLVDRCGVEVGYHGADVTRPSEIEALVERTEGDLGPVDIVVNNAGIQHVAPVDEFPVERWDAILAVDLSSAFHTTRLTLAGMKSRRWGRIINIASAHGLVASPFKSAYVAAKHGLVGLTKTVALEAAEHGVTVNAICPGYVLTPLVQGQLASTARARGLTEEEVKRDVMLAAQPTSQFVTTQQVASLTVYLCRDEAASITGASLTVDGGWTAQ